MFIGSFGYTGKTTNGNRIAIELAIGFAAEYTTGNYGNRVTKPVTARNLRAAPFRNAREREPYLRLLRTVFPTIFPTIDNNVSTSDYFGGG